MFLSESCIEWLRTKLSKSTKPPTEDTRTHSNQAAKKKTQLCGGIHPRRKRNLHRDRKPSATTHKTSSPLPWEKSLSNTYH